MRIHDIGPRTDEVDYPAAKGTVWSWRALSRWGSRPFREFGRALSLLLAEALLVGLGLGTFPSCAEAKAVSAGDPVSGVGAGRIDRVWLGFALDLQGRVTPGCAASKFAMRDPIHLSLQVTDAQKGSVVRVSVQDVVTRRIAWSENRPVPPGVSYQTFEIGREIAQGRYRAESSLGNTATNPREFVVHDRREGAQ